MKKVYVYVLDTLADWEIGHVTSELCSARFFKKDAPKVEIKTVGVSKDEVVTMGGLRIIPDLTLSDIVVDKDTTIILPGANTWNEEKNYSVISKAQEILKADGTVCAICGATVALASVGMLDEYKHTSNGKGFLEMFVPTYKGTHLFVDENSVIDRNLITASVVGAIDFAKNILTHLEVFSDETMKEWELYFKTGKAEHFFALMQSVQ